MRLRPRSTSVKDQKRFVPDDKMFLLFLFLRISNGILVQNRRLRHSFRKINHFCEGYLAERIFYTQKALELKEKYCTHK
jgi:hypothetical protein